MGGYALIFSKILHFFWRLSHRRVFQRRALYRPKIKRDKTEQGPDLGLFLEVHFLENLVFTKAFKKTQKKRKNSYDSYDT